MIGIQLDNYDVKVEDKSLVLGDILHQNQAILLSMHKGELKERPEMGIGIEDMLLDNDPLYWRTTIKENLEMDNQKVTKVSVSLNGISIDSTY